MRDIIYIKALIFFSNRRQNKLHPLNLEHSQIIHARISHFTFINNLYYKRIVSRSCIYDKKNV